MLDKRDYEQAIEAWEGGACNSRALINALHRVMQKIDEHGDAFNTHPIVTLYISQLAFLADIGIGEDNGKVKEIRKLLEYID